MISKEDLQELINSCVELAQSGYGNQAENAATVLQGILFATYDKDEMESTIRGIQRFVDSCK